MAKAHGKKGKLKVKNAAGELKDISEYLTSAGLPRDVDLAESSGLGQDDKTFVAGLRGGTIPIAGSWDPTVDGILSGILTSATGETAEWQYYPAGEGAGNVKYSGAALLGSYEAGSDIGSVGKISGTFTVTGAVTRTVL